MEVQTNTPPRYSVPSLIAIFAAIASFFVGAFWGFVLAGVAVVCGAIGVMLAFSAKIRGGVVSSLAVAAGLLGLLAAVAKGIAWAL